MFIAFVAGAAATAAAPSPIDPVSWFGADSYPMDAQKKGIEGSVTYDVRVDRDGKPTSCRIVGSSGSRILDQATCGALLSKAKFTPAIGPNGQPVASHYINKAIWRMPDKLRASYRAVILDFSADPLHPVCTIRSTGSEVGEPTCAQFEDQASTAGLPQKVTKLVHLLSTAPDTDVPYQGEPDWGARILYIAADQYYLKGSFPIACISVAAEGAAAGRDPCGGFPGSRALTDVERQKATRTRVETSIFAVPRASSAGTDDTKSP